PWFAHGRQTTKGLGRPSSIPVRLTAVSVETALLHATHVAIRALFSLAFSLAIRGPCYVRGLTAEKLIAHCRRAVCAGGPGSRRRPWHESVAAPRDWNQYAENPSPTTLGLHRVDPSPTRRFVPGAPVPPNSCAENSRRASAWSESSIRATRTSDPSGP